MIRGDVLLARHGQTEWNTQQRWQGQLDSPLTDNGRQAAAGLARLASARDVGAVFTSPLPRARETAAAAADVLGVELQVLPDLAEMHHGAMAGLTPDDADARFPGQRARRAEDKYTWRFPGGESYADVDARVAVALRCIRGKHALRPLVVSHEMVGRMLLRQLTGMPLRRALGRQQPHHVIYRVTPSTGAFVELSTAGPDGAPAASGTCRT